MYRHMIFIEKFDKQAKFKELNNPNRSCYIMLVKFMIILRIRLAPQKIKVGDIIESGSKKEIKIGNYAPSRYSVGINIQCWTARWWWKKARSAGASVQLVVLMEIIV